MFNKSLPQNIKVEQEVLSSIFDNPRSLNLIVQELNTDDFYLEKHKVIYSSMCSLYAEGKKIDVTLLVELVGTDNLDKVGGVSYLTELSVGATPIDLKQSIDILLDKSFRRKAIKEMDNVIKALYESNSRPNDLISKMNDKLINGKSKKSILTDIELLEKTLTVIEQRYNSGGGIPGMRTGLPTFDKAINGLKRGELFILGGRPSMGKTLIALTLGDGLAANGYKVGLIEMEMTEESLGIRRLSYKASIDGYKLQQGRINIDDFERLSTVFNKLSKTNNFYTDCSDYQSILTIKAKAKLMKQTYGLDVLIIDHLGLMDIPGDNRTNAIGEITRQLKLLSKELDINIILLCQLSRAVEQRIDKRPLLSDLRDSGNIEQDADLVVFAYRDEYYNKETEDKNIMEWNIAKQRNGRTGVLKFAYIDKIQKIAELDSNHI